MLLRHICRPQAVEKLEYALENCATAITGDRDGATCEAYANALIELL
jgi:hypothetical protein